MKLQFRWNESKATDNYAKHGVSFGMATRVFKDPFTVSTSTTGRTMARRGSF
jgi:uncharacterized DUF497 family protein